MRWLLGKLDSLLSTVIGAAAGLAASQVLAFIQQYRQRLGGHLAEAQLNLRETLDSELYRGLEPAAQRALASPLADRVSDLADTLNALGSSGPWLLPWAFVRELELGIAAATLAEFRPALPLDLVSLSYGAAGILVGWLVYDLLKAPFRRRRRRA